MSVRFVVGRAGSGKTRWCFERIVEATTRDPLGPPIYWLLPRQATFEAERELTCNSGLPAICRVIVTSPSQLGQLILQQCGGAAIPEITAHGRQMVLGRLLRTHRDELRFFKSVARRPGLAAELDSAFGEFERSGKSSVDLLELEREFNDSNSDFVRALGNKIHDLRLLYDAYQNHLGTETLDQHTRFERVLKCVAKWTGTRDAQIYCDGFLEFADNESRLLVALAQGGAELSITSLMEPNSRTVSNPHHLPDELDIFHRTITTYRRLHIRFTEAKVAIEKPVLLAGDKRNAPASLKLLEQDLFTRRKPAPVEATGVTLIEAPTCRAEVDVIARQIQKWTQNEHLRFRDIAVLARDLGDYAELIESSFAEHGIRCFLDRRRTASHHPLLRMVRLLPSLTDRRWPHDTVIGLLKTGLFGVSLDEADEVESYVITHRIGGAGWAIEEPWNYRKRSFADEQADENPIDEQSIRVDALRKTATQRLKPWSDLLAENKPLPVSTIVEAMQALLKNCAIEQTLSTWIESAEDHPEQQAEHEQVWNNLIALLNQTSELLGTEQVTALEFAEILETGLEQFDLAITPPTLDQVLVGSIDRTRTSSHKAVILIGWCEGGFPRRASASSILSDADRRSLREQKMDLAGDTERKLLDEQLLAYIAVTRATQHLCISRPTGDDAGRPLPPSPYWDRVRKLLPDAPVEAIHQGMHSPRIIGTPRQLVGEVMRWANDTPLLEHPMAGIYDWLARHEDQSSPIGQMRHLAWPALSYRNEATLFAETAAELFRSPMTLPVRQLESFATCPYQHFARSGLRLRESERHGVSSIDLLGLYRSVLKRVIGDFIRKNRNWKIAVQETRELVHHHTLKVGRTLRDEIMLSSARNRYLLLRAEQVLQQVMASQEEMLRRGEFRPTKLGYELPKLPLRTPSGKQLTVTGRSDRADLSQLGDTAAVSLIEYRWKAYAPNLTHAFYGLSLQPLANLMLLQTSCDGLDYRPMTPVAAFNVQLDRRLRNVAHPTDALAPPDSDLDPKPRGILIGEYLSRFDSGCTDGETSQVISAGIKLDGELAARGDPVSAAEFAALLSMVRDRIVEIAEQFYSGDISVSPYRLGNASPCARCSYRSVCRFEVGVNRYRMLPVLNRSQVLARVTGEQASGESE